MPFTPFHFGPGVLIKSILWRRFSLLVFIVSQILIDCETAWNILAGNERLHTFFHTYLGSLAIVAVLTLATKPLFRASALMWPSHSFNNGEPPIWLAAISALIGVWSHVFLDSTMHRDITPFAPFSDGNPLLNTVSLTGLHFGCLLSAMLGLVIVGGRFSFRKIIRKLLP